MVEGTWYFDIKVVYLGKNGHTTLGWSTQKGEVDPYEIGPASRNGSIYVDMRLATIHEFVCGLLCYDGNTWLLSS